MNQLFPETSFAEVPAALKRIKFILAYDGTPFSGFVENRGVTTVAGVLRKNMEQVLGHQVRLVCAGRTDRGVHAWGQVVSCDVRAGTDIEALQKSMNMMCRPHLALRDVTTMPAEFSARFDATSRTYQYRILNTAIPNPFLTNTTWRVSRPLDFRAMQGAVTALLGEHDFTSFCRKQENVSGEIKTRVRNLLRAEWKAESSEMLVFEVQATAFCQQMVRSIVGTMADVGLGRMNVADVKVMLESQDRRESAHVAPPQGLTLWAVGY
ncbi:MAG: tRNA pseudouridine(38-40) synthase TruA [Acidimicrobiales bacterium]